MAISLLNLALLSARRYKDCFQEKFVNYNVQECNDSQLLNMYGKLPLILFGKCKQILLVLKIATRFLLLGILKRKYSFL